MQSSRQFFIKEIKTDIYIYKKSKGLKKLFFLKIKKPQPTYPGQIDVTFFKYIASLFEAGINGMP